MKQGQFPAVLNLTDLNGQNGFKLDGENNGDGSGNSVSAAGDVNGDGHTDLVIGASYYPAGGNKGRSYVVFGGLGVGSNGTIALSSLNGVNGFKLDGENDNDRSVVRATGDINGDGHADLLIGAYGYPANSFKGRSYVVFGGPGVGSSGTIALSSLNGTNGFKLDGENGSDDSGVAVSAAGDINGDGYVDLVIGAPGYPAAGANGKGRSYLVFGGPGVGSTGTIPLLNLNGVNGFKLDGENNGDWSGVSVSAAGDINGDGHADLLIGANQYPARNSTGRSYVVFGGPGVGSNGTLALSGLNGANGFKLDGENKNDDSGYPLSAAGDINGDGYADLVIGAEGYPAGGQTGRSYVVFGGPGVGSSGTFALSSLSGANGFKLDGENFNDHSGYPVSTAGDINGDGYADLLISASYYPAGSGKGRSYVVFGGPGVSKNGSIALSSLNGVNGFKLDGENNGDQSGDWASAAGDINGDGVDDLLIGAYQYPNGNGAGRSYVVFGDIPPVLVNNRLSLSVGAVIQLNATYLAAYDRNHNNNTLVFVSSAVTHGQFEIVGAPGVPLVNFTQQQITSGAIQFVHDSSLVAPSYNISVFSTGIAWTGPLSAKINFIGVPQSYFPAILPLASLNGKNGFKLDGETFNDASGGSMSAAGDINADGHADLLIGAPLHANNTGRSYVVFGGAGIGSQGLLALSALNGTNGFKLYGEAKGDQSGHSVSAAGDVNGDGRDDLLIGAFCHLYIGANCGAGRSYVVFGDPKIGSQGLLALSALNGTNGFKLNGEVANDQSGDSVSTAGDINDDGYGDLLIGAYAHASATGRSYVLFGGLGVGHQGMLSLSILNGTNGFKLDGETTGDESAVSVKAVGDINGDGHTDLLIGAWGHATNTGRSYVVFGGVGVGNQGLFALSTLNGLDGFKLDGEASGDKSGFSVSSAGDVNGDSYADLLIGAWGHVNNTGRSYVVFGSSGVGGQGLLVLSTLNGANGFKLDGEAEGDQSGYSVSVVGDINGDGHADLLIGAPYHSGYTGRSYIVFGGVGVGSQGLLTLSVLNGMNGFKLDGETGGDQSGFSVSATGDINGDGVVDILIGAIGHHNLTGRSYVVFGDIPPTLVQNRLSLYPGLTVRLHSSFLAAYDRNQNNNTLIFSPTNVTHGYFSSVSQPGVSLVNFTQPQLLNNTIQFVHDGTLIAPSYNITVRSAGIAWTGPHVANITFTRAPIILVNNQLAISDGGQVILSPTQLQATEAGYNNSQLVFLIGNIKNGNFTLTTKNTVRLLSFNQAQLASGAVRFTHVGNGQSPGYTVVVTDGVQYTAPGTAAIDFIGAPVIIENSLTLQQSQTVTLTPSNLNVTVTDGSSLGQVICQVEDLQNAVITETPGGLPVSNFTLIDLQVGKIQVTQDGSDAAVSYVLSCGGQAKVNSVPNTVTTYFSNNGVLAPQLINNYLLITQGGKVTLTSQNIGGTENGTQSLGSSAVFYISGVTHGSFGLRSLPGFSITSFTEAQLQNGSVLFTQDNSLFAPGYQLSVRALGLQSASLPASVIFQPVNQPPQLVHALTDQTATVGTPFSYAIPGDSFVDPQGEVLDLLVSRFNSNLSLPSWLQFDNLSNRFTGTPPTPDFIDINVTARDPEGLAKTTDFTLTVLAASGDTGYSTVQKAIIGAVVSGTIGIFFAALQGCLKRAANKKLLQALGEDADPYDQNVVCPMAKEIAKRVKITGFMNATTNAQMVKFKGAVRSLLTALDQRGVELNFSEMKPTQKDAVINEIGNQVHRWVKAHRRGCTVCCPSFTAFFKPQLNPDSLQAAVDEIADQVAQALKKPQSLSAALSVSGSPVFKEESPRKQSVELLPAEPVRSDLSVSQLS